MGSGKPLYFNYNNCNMKYIFTAVTFICSILIFQTGNAQIKRYVKVIASGSGNGSSWANASSDLQAMLDASAPNDEVWVAKGTYKPTVPYGTNVSQVPYTGDRHKTFHPSRGVKMYGGFAGNESSIGQRKLDLNKTILSGDLQGNDIGFTNNAENAYHVIVLRNPYSSMTIDGFTITGGNTTGLPPTYLYEPPVVNEIAPDGAGIYSIGTDASIANCLFINNFSTRNGGAVCDYGYTGVFAIVNSVFLNNQALQGSVLYCGDGWHSQQNYIANCTMVNNISTAATIAKNINLGDFNVENCILWNNTATGLQIYPGYVKNSIVQDFITNGGAALFGVTESNPQFTNLNDPDGADNIMGTSDDGLIPQCGPAIGTGKGTVNLPTKDFRNAARVQFGTIDMGAYESSLMHYVTSLTMSKYGNMATSEDAAVAGFCEGRNAGFYVETGNGGVFQWKRNGINVGTNSYLYTTSSLDNGDVISVTLTSPAGCGPANVVSVNSGPLSVAEAIPPRPAVLYGPTNPCPFINGPAVTYYINKIPHAQYYHWRALNTPGVTITHPNGLGANDTLVYVSFNSNFVGGGISVQGESNCGLGAYRKLNLYREAPRTIAAIIGEANPCPYMQSTGNPAGTALTYSLKKVANAATYTWTVPAGATITSHPGGSGANDTAITVIYSSSFVSGSITVQAHSPCGSTGIRAFNVSRKASNTPGSITGPTTVCSYLPSPGNPLGIPVNYTIKKVLYATSYTWTIPAGATAIHPMGSGINDTVITVTYNSNFTGGVITVKSNTNCNTSAVRSLSILYKMPGTPGTITAGVPTACPLKRVTYTIANIPSYASSVLWTVPPSGTLISGQGTTSIVVQYAGPTSSTDTIRVVGISDCGISSQRKLKVTALPACRPAGEEELITLQNRFTPEPTIDMAQDIRVTPNPSNHQFAIKLNDDKSHTKIMLIVLDAQGRIIEKMTPNFANPPITIGSAWKPGVYFMQISRGDKTWKQKLVKL